ncbi:MAG: hypothetical protein NUV60_02315 [Patescibacteria group bacterium]|nr:hypothetical protein [Patescibacteria group bacterium]
MRNRNPVALCNTQRDQSFATEPVQSTLFDRSLRGNRNAYCGSPVVEDNDLLFGNLYDRHYDEAIGPPKDDRFIPVDELDCGEWTEEDEREYWDRVLLQNPDEPLGPGETRTSVLEDMRYEGMRIVAEPGYQANLGPAKVAVRRFGQKDFQPAKAGIATISVRKFDRKTKRWVKAQASVRVLTSRLRHRTIITVH